MVVMMKLLKKFRIFAFGFYLRQSFRYLRYNIFFFIMRKILFILMVCVACFQSAATENYRVNAPSGLNVRTHPDKNAQVIGRLENGSNIEVVEIYDNWAQIEYKGKTSYISMQYLEPIGPMNANAGNSQGKTHGRGALPIAILVLAIVSCYLIGHDNLWIGAGVNVLNLCLVWYQLGATPWPLWFVTERGVGFGWMIVNMFLLLIAINLIWTSISVTLSMLEIDKVSIWATKILFVFKVFSPGSTLLVLLILWTLGYAIYRSIRESEFTIVGLSIVGMIIMAIVINGGGALCASTFYGFDAFILLAGVFPTILEWIGDFGSSTSSSSRSSELKVYEVTDYDGRRHTLTQNSKYSECNYTDEDGHSWERDSGGFHRV